MKLSKALKAIKDERNRAINLHLDPNGGPDKFKNYHEGISIIREEFEELWDEVKRVKPGVVDKEALQTEAIQLGAMVLRFLTELT